MCARLGGLSLLFMASVMVESGLGTWNIFFSWACPWLSAALGVPHRLVWLRGDGDGEGKNIYASLSIKEVLDIN